MEPQPLTAAERVAQLIQALDITAYQFAKATGLSHQTISNVLTGKNRPSLDTLEAIAKRYPDTAIWLLSGTGDIRTGNAEVAPAPLAPAPTAAEEPTAAYTTPAPAGVVDKMLAHISELGQRHSDDLKAAKKDYNRRVIEQATLWQNTVDVMERQLEDLRATVREQKQEIWDLQLRCGLRAPTPAEAEALRKQAQERKEQDEKGKLEVTGFKKYGTQPVPEPDEVAMHVTVGDQPLEDFSWQPAADSPLTLQRAA